MMRAWCAHAVGHVSNVPLGCGHTGNVPHVRNRPTPPIVEASSSQTPKATPATCGYNVFRGRTACTDERGAANCHTLKEKDNVTLF